MTLSEEEKRELEELRTLAQSLAYGYTECETDEDLINYLQTIDDESVKAILKEPAHMVRELTKETYTQVLRKAMSLEARALLENGKFSVEL